MTSRINPATLNEERDVPAAARVTPYASHIVPPPAPSYRISPDLLAGGAIGVAALLLLAALVLGRRYLRRGGPCAPRRRRELSRR